MNQPTGDPGGKPGDFVTRGSYNDVTHTWTLDGCAGIPDAVAARLAGQGDDFRLATWGKVQRIFVYDFAPPRTVVVCEKGALVYLGENAAPWNVQGVQLHILPAVLAAP